MQRIAIIGSTEFAHQLIYYFESTAFGTVAGMFDDFEVAGTIKYDRPILGKTSDIPELFKKGAFDTVVISVGYKHRKFRRDVYQHLKKNQVPIATFIHPNSLTKAAMVAMQGI